MSTEAQREIHRLLREQANLRDELQMLVDAKERARRGTQILIEEIGSIGPESVESAARRAVAIIRELRSGSSPCLTCEGSGTMPTQWADNGTVEEDEGPCPDCSETKAGESSRGISAHLLVEYEKAVKSSDEAIAKAVLSSGMYQRLLHGSVADESEEEEDEGPCPDCSPEPSIFEAQYTQVPCPNVLEQLRTWGWEVVQGQGRDGRRSIQIYRPDGGLEVSVVLLPDESPDAWLEQTATRLLQRHLR